MKVRQSLAKLPAVQLTLVHSLLLAVIVSFILTNFVFFFERGTNSTPHARCCGPGCRRSSPQTKRTEKHYDQKYFNWQVC